MDLVFANSVAFLNQKQSTLNKIDWNIGSFERYNIIEVY